VASLYPLGFFSEILRRDVVVRFEKNQASTTTTKRQLKIIVNLEQGMHQLVGVVVRGHNFLFGFCLVVVVVL